MKAQNEFIVVKESVIHGRGIFAKKDISKGTRIIEYKGKKITKKESDKVFDKDYKEASQDPSKGEVYLFELNNKYDIDGNIPENVAKYINHSCEPNCETENEDEEKIWVLALKDIKTGQELSFNYGFNIEEHEDYPCKCGTNSCVGFILEEEQWPKLNKQPGLPNIKR
tara:strand:+ start:61 stop:564 length:504 start_codon:yes stop_codon:yes gene_type:complete